MRIGITYTSTEEKHMNYVNWIKGNDDIEIVKLWAEDDNLHELDSCDALLLSGGRDIHPKYYGGKMPYPGAPEDFDEKRDEFEMACFRKAQERKMPVLGICRGMQLINVIQGGTLIQDLEPLMAIYNHREDYHHIGVIEKTLLQQVTGSLHGEINSAHHQAVDVPGEGLRVNARSDDGTIEGIEWEDSHGKAFMLAIQWHPERMFSMMESPMSKNIREKFIAEIKKL